MGVDVDVVVDVHVHVHVHVVVIVDVDVDVDVIGFCFGCLTAALCLLEKIFEILSNG